MKGKTIKFLAVYSFQNNFIKFILGFGTDEDAIIQVLSTRSNSQRQEIATVFKNEYGRVNFFSFS